MLFFSDPSGDHIQSLALESNFIGFKAYPYVFPLLGRVTILFHYYSQKVIISVLPNYFTNISYVHNATIMTLQYNGEYFSTSLPNQFCLQSQFILSDSDMRVADIFNQICLTLNATGQTLGNFQTTSSVSYYYYTNAAPLRFFKSLRTYFINQDINMNTVFYDVIDYSTATVLEQSLKGKDIINVFRYN